jgi:hypothetical protein
MKTIAIQRTRRNSEQASRADRDGLAEFFEYACRNGDCVLSRFDRFSMAATAEARCPVCGQEALPAGDEAGAAN